MDQILDQIAGAINGFFSTAIVQLAIQASAVYFVILWLACAYWAFRDMQQRTDNPILPYLAATLIIVFTPIFFLFAVVVYKIVRPHEKSGEAYERGLAQEAMLAEIEQVRHCPTCNRQINEEWIVCPTCRTRLNRVCPNCTRLVGLDWTLCAWCGKDFERREMLSPVPSYTPAPEPLAIPEESELPQVSTAPSRTRTGSVRAPAPAPARRTAPGS